MFKGDVFYCPQCEFQPEVIEGFSAFAPELIRENDGFKPESFADLYTLEAQSFWFTSRNKIVLWALNKFFPKTENMLEIGCGTGFVLEGITQKRPDISLYGSEIFIQGLHFARQRLKDKADLFQMDARNIPYYQEFDVIGAFDVLEHIKEDEKVLNQMHHALVPGGGWSLRSHSTNGCGV
jgi:SAM-dependent methyltransferase